MAEADKEPIQDIITVLTEFCPRFEWKVSASSENKNQSLPIFQPRHSCPDGKGEARHSGRGFTRFKTSYLSSSEEKYSFQSMSSTESSFISQSYCISGIEDW